MSSPIDAEIVGGHGDYVYLKGEREAYLDCVSGATAALGHNNKDISRVLLEHIQGVHAPYTVWSGTFSTLQCEEYCDKLQEITGNRFKAIFCQSGTEANEMALRLARIVTGKNAILYSTDVFHGRAGQTAMVSDSSKYRAGFPSNYSGPENYFQVPFGYLDEVVEEFKRGDVAGIIVEPIQGSGYVGVRPHDTEYLRELRRLCDEYGVVLIFDEVQSGLGRTGHWFAYERYGVIPDVLTLGKYIGEGTNFSSVLARSELVSLVQPGQFTAIYRGNTLSFALGKVVLKEIESKGLLQRALEVEKIMTDTGDLFRNSEPEFGEVVDSYVWCGVMGGIKFKGEYAPRFVDLMRQYRVLVYPMGPYTVKFQPFLNMSRGSLAQLQRAFRFSIGALIKEVTS